MGRRDSGGRSKGKGKGKGSQGFNRKNSEDFLDKNSRKDGVVTTESGLQYIVVDEKEGDSPTPDHTVIVQQRIMLIDGTIIADTYKGVEPATFTMKEAIEGYREGMQLMSVGARYKFFIPSDLAWGKRGAGNKIGPYTTLIIDCRLVEIY
jgi:FKBP-type peptidyl-prolyl cis-trans isomerase FkpA